eukprot:5981621-Pyramimonas_sp.AAC.1
MSAQVLLEQNRRAERILPAGLRCCHEATRKNGDSAATVRQACAVGLRDGGTVGLGTAGPRGCGTEGLRDGGTAGPWECGAPVVFDVTEEGGDARVGPVAAHHGQKVAEQVRLGDGSVHIADHHFRVPLPQNRPLSSYQAVSSLESSILPPSLYGRRIVERRAPPHVTSDPLVLVRKLTNAAD